MKTDTNSNSNNVNSSCDVKKKIAISYYDAVNWYGNHRILCNNIGEIDPSIYDNFRFPFYLDDDYETHIEIFQYFLTNCNQIDVELLEDKFNLKFTYSEKLDCFVLCVDHFGTDWRGVPCYVDDEDFEKSILENPDHWEYVESCHLYRFKK